MDLVVAMHVLEISVVILLRRFNLNKHVRESGFVLNI
jgi:hypothetical protein